MNLFHPLSEPTSMLAMLTIACAWFFVMLLYFVWSGRRSVRTDPLKDVIRRCNEHCRIKAEYDCRG